MNDDTLRALSQIWRGNAPAADEIARRFQRHQTRIRTQTYLSILGILVILAGLYWVTTGALQSGGAERWIVVAAFALAVPPSIYGAVEMHRRSRQKHDASAVGLLLQAQSQVGAARSIVVSGRICSAILLFATSALWILMLAGGIDLDSILLPSAAWGVTAALIWLWQSIRSRQLAARMGAIEAALEQFRQAEADR